MIPDWPVVGRDAQVAAILDGLQRQVGTVVVGDAGVGKTVLAREVKRRLDAAGHPTELVLCSRWSGFALPALEARPGTATDSRADRTTVLVVDDAHVLDDETADTLWRLAGTGRAVVVATVRAGEPVPERVARLWADGACDRLDLDPLAEDDVRVLLESVLGGDVEDRLARLLVHRAAGNALLLRELVRSAVASGAIARSHEVWRLAGELPVGSGIAELILGGLEGLDRDEIEAVELLAVAEPLQLEIGQSEIGARLIDALEAKRVVALEQTSDGPVLTLGHPLYGEVVRPRIAPLRLRRLRLGLVEAIGREPVPSVREVLRSALWRVELGEPADPHELIAAARLARSSSDATAERLARAAFDASGAIEARLLLAETMIMHGRVVEAERLLDNVVLDTLPASDRQAVVFIRAMGRTRVGEMSAVAAMILGADPTGSESSVQLQATYAQALMLDGRVDESFAAAVPLFEDPTVDPVTRTLAACAVIAGGALAGQFDRSEATMRAGVPVAEQARDALPYGMGTMMVASVIAIANSGRLDRAEEVGRDIYDRALRDDDEWLRPRGASGLGVVALGRGLPRTATRYFRITVASLNEFDGLWLRYNLSFLARAAALAGFVDEAGAAMHPAPDAPRLPFFEADWEIAQAAVLAAGGAIDAASEQALRAARRAASIGQWAASLMAAHDAARYAGSAEAAELAALAVDRVDGPLGPILADHARARAACDAKLLADVSERFEALGWMLHACEAAYAAARAYRADLDGRAGVKVAAHAGELHAQCEDAFIPWVAGFDAASSLTRREQQVAILAAAGHADAAIAEQLRISVRTVQNHLSRAYTKLGVTSRRELPAAFAAGRSENPV